MLHEMLLLDMGASCGMETLFYLLWLKQLLSTNIGERKIHLVIQHNYVHQKTQVLWICNKLRKSVSGIPTFLVLYRLISLNNITKLVHLHFFLVLN